MMIPCVVPAGACFRPHSCCMKAYHYLMPAGTLHCHCRIISIGKGRQEPHNPGADALDASCTGGAESVRSLEVQDNGQRASPGGESPHACLISIHDLLSYHSVLQLENKWTMNGQLMILTSRLLVLHESQYGTSCMVVVLFPSLPIQSLTHGRACSAADIISDCDHMKYKIEFCPELMPLKMHACMLSSQFPCMSYAD